MKNVSRQKVLSLVFESAPMGIFTVGPDFTVTSFNPAAERLTGYSRQEALGRRCYEVFRTNICQDDCPMKRSIRTGEDTREREVTILDRKGEEIPISISTAALRDDGGEVLGGVEMFRNISQLVELRKRLDGQYVFQDIVSKNAAMRRILDRLPLVAQSPSTVLIEGASGTGKELIARALHNLSSRRQKPFVALNCAALPDSLLESELFGYVRGAFTDARKDRKGRFAQAEGGTLFLDEIGDVSPAFQAKLLRVVQEREYEPLGSGRTVKTDVRLIAATNRDLAQEVQLGRFRQDLYFRLHVVGIRLPGLGERREDILLLSEHFIRRCNALYGRSVAGLSEAARAALLRAPYPGNVRELENAIEHAFALSEGETLHLEHLPDSFLEAAGPLASLPEETTGRDLLEEAEARAIRVVLQRHLGGRLRAAEELGISRNTLWRKMRRLGLLS
jgi:PAS domain S-box-containing protein